MLWTWFYMHNVVTLYYKHTSFILVLVQFIHPYSVPNEVATYSCIFLALNGLSHLPAQ